MEEKQGRNLVGVILNTKIPVEPALCRIWRALAPVAWTGRSSTLSFPHYSETLQRRKQNSTEYYWHRSSRSHDEFLSSYFPSILHAFNTVPRLLPRLLPPGRHILRN